ncbi:class I SAM-dependent methyltransferase [Luteococcus peritonei]|uniref:Class I SAM-dependent methyltransferase n=1 Tax=Luteococcus peritonei TaxID=88874 RepID=A0ABW4RYY7_9ACTN
MADWSEYLAEFHAERPGITEQVLRRCIAGHHPYRWLARAVSSSAVTVLDIGCGSGALERELRREGRTVVGIDISTAEVERARQSGEGPLALADGRALPFRDESFDCVVTALGLAVIQPTATLLDEIARVLRPGGVLVGLVPTVRPLSVADLRVAGRLTRLLQTTPQFPVQIELTVGQLLAEHGLRKAEDARERYRFAVRSREDAELLTSSFYLPHTRPERVAAAVDWMAARAAAEGQLDVPVPMRRVVAIK